MQGVACSHADLRWEIRQVSGVTESQAGERGDSASVPLPNSGSFGHNRNFTNLYQEFQLLSDST